MKVTVIELFLPESRTERDVKSFLIKHPSIIEADAKFIVEELQLIRGKIDLLFATEKENIFIEVKRKNKPSPGDVNSVKDQLFKYYESIGNMCKIFGIELKRFKMFLVIGYNNADGDKRYEVDFKEGKFFHKIDDGIRRSRKENVTDRYFVLENDLRQSIISLKEEYKGVFDELNAEKDELDERNELVKSDILLLKGEIKWVNGEKQRISNEINKLLSDKKLLLQNYGDKLLYIIPEYWDYERNPRKCFVCDIKSEIVVQPPNSQTFGLCQEHFTEILRVRPKI